MGGDAASHERRRPALRVLLASTGLAGHLGPLLPFGEAARRRGDEVLLAVPPAQAELAQQSGLPWQLTADPPRDRVAAVMERFANATRRERWALIDRELFGRLQTEAALPALERLWQDFCPQLVLREPCEYASAVLAERQHTPHHQVAISLAEVESAALKLAAGAVDPHHEGVSAAIRRSGYLSRFPQSLDPSPYPRTLRYREPEPAAAGPSQRWGPEGGGPLVYLTLGTMAPRLPAAATAYRALLEAVSGLPLRALLTVGRTFERELLLPVPANVRVERWVPQAEALAEASLVVCHGGSGTTLGALGAGLPLVMLPMFADQLPNAARAARAGAAVVVRAPGLPGGPIATFGPDQVAAIRAAISRVLQDAEVTKAARRVQAEMLGQPRVDQLLDQLASG